MNSKQLRYLFLVLLATLGILLLLGCSPQGISIRDQEATVTAEAAAQQTEAEETFLTYCEKNPTRCIMEGDPDADLVVYEFSDYGCPHCKTYAEEQYPLVHDNLIETDEIRYISIPAALFGTPPNTAGSVNAMLCALEQGRPDFHGALFSIHVPNADPEQASILQLGESEGLDMSAFQPCVENEQYASEAAANRAVVVDGGINSTPTLLLNGERVQASYQVLTQAIAAARR